ncbi:MAG: hypothetical protein LUE25_01485 [Clostridiales bacterium]|nr:hypothetical protein [Clostridiales bacterium]
MKRNRRSGLLPLVFAVIMLLCSGVVCGVLCGALYVETEYTPTVRDTPDTTAPVDTDPTIDTNYKMDMPTATETTGGSDETTASQPEEILRNWEGEIAGGEVGNNVFTITWSSQFGDSFEVQRYYSDLGEWETEYTISADGSADTSYTTPRLVSFSETRYRVVARGTTYYAVSDEIVFTTEQCVVSSIIWPVDDLTAYTTSSGNTQAGNVETLKAYLVVDEADGRFGVDVNGETWYIDSDYCMINLPDYVGELCEYNITNSYSSIYMVHDYSIPDMTGTVIVGYEDVQISEDEYYVPLLYPTAKKLVVAGQSALEQGYRIRIYDSYRPNEATVYMYKTLSSVLDDTIPETFNILTYRDVIFGETSYTLTYFVAYGRSMHNLGIAMDLTIVDVETGEELEMQTSLHDLSHYSEVSNNNESAALLRSIMLSAGFSPLVSEWWHFQDNEAYSDLSLPTLSGGVKGLED